MATDYNVLATPFTDKSAMENNEYSTSCKPSCGMIHPIECARGQTPVTRLYTRNSAPPPNSDQRLYDIGRFQIATQGMQSNGVGVIGELWASYEIKFLKPQVATNNQFNLYYDHYVLSTGITDTRLLKAAALQAGSNIGTIIDDTLNLVQFPPSAPLGRYAVTYHLQGTAPATGNMQIADPGTFIGCNVVTDWHTEGGTASFVSNFLTPLQKAMFTMFEIDLTAHPASFILDINDPSDHVPTGTQGGDFRIYNINNLVH